MGILSSLTIKVENGKLIMPDLHNVQHSWLPVDSTTFRKESSNKLVVFNMNEDNEVVHAFIGNWVVFALDRTSGVWNQGLHITIIALTSIFIIYILFIWPIIYFLRRGITSNFKPII